MTRKFLGLKLLNPIIQYEALCLTNSNKKKHLRCLGVCISQNKKMMILSEIIIFPWLLRNVTFTRMESEYVHCFINKNCLLCTWNCKLSIPKQKFLAQEGKLKARIFIRAFSFLC